MPHYYTKNSSLESNRQSFIFTYDKFDFHFTSDIGVFSKEFIDYGTRVLLNAITVENSYGSLLDVGCGYGPIGICLKKLYPQLEVTMVDVNDRAIELAKYNAGQNGVEVEVFESNCYQNVDSSFDLIVTNPPIRAGKEVVMDIIVNSFGHLNDNGSFYAVVQKKQGAGSIKKALESVYGNCEVVKRDKGYYILKAIKSV